MPILSINRIHKLLSVINNRVGTGFLGEMPNDLWSICYTRWLIAAGAQIGLGSRIHHKVKVWLPENLIIGARVMVPRSTDIAGMARIEIGDNVMIGAQVSFITNHHRVLAPSLPYSDVLNGTQMPISVGSNCWLMNRVMLVAGTHGLRIGCGAQIAAGAVVTKNVPSGELWGGVPARRIRNSG